MVDAKNPENGNGEGALFKKTRGLPLKQRLYLEYAPLLYDLTQKFPTIYASIADKHLGDNLKGVFDKVGFSSHFNQTQETRQLVQNISTWLKKNHMVLLHYQPKYSTSTLINLLRQLKSAGPNVSFAGLVPVFLKSVSSKQQLDIFRLLGNFGIKYAMFLTPNADEEKNIEELLEGLVDYSDMFKEKVSEEEQEVLESDEWDTGKVEKYKTLNAEGEELMKEGKFEEAIEVFTKAINLKPNFNVLIQRGDAFFKVRKYVAALRDYREANKVRQSEPAPHAKIGACCFAMVKTTLKKDGPEKAKKVFQMGMAHLEKSAKIVDKLVSEDKNFPEKLPPGPYAPILNALAETDIRGMGLKEEEGKVAGLIGKFLEKSKVEDDSDNLMTVDEKIDRSILLTRAKLYGEAENILRGIIATDPEHAGPAFNNFAVELRKNGQLGKAFQIYDEVLGFKIPDRDIVVENLKMAGLKFASILREKFRPQEAIGIYKTVLGHNPEKKEWVLCELAVTFIEMEDMAHASNRIMEAIFANPHLTGEKEFAKYKKDLGGLIDEMANKLSNVKKSNK